MRDAYVSRKGFQIFSDISIVGCCWSDILWKVKKVLFFKYKSLRISHPYKKGQKSSTSPVDVEPPQTATCIMELTSWNPVGKEGKYRDIIHDPEFGLLPPQVCNLCATHTLCNTHAQTHTSSFSILPCWSSAGQYLISAWINMRAFECFVY